MYLSNLQYIVPSLLSDFNSFNPKIIFKVKQTVKIKENIRDIICLKRINLKTVPTQNLFKLFQVFLFY